MANIEITELTSQGTLNPNDLIIIKNQGDNGDYKVLISTLNTYIGNNAYDQTLNTTDDVNFNSVSVQGTPLATVATSGDYNDLSNLPTLGTAAAANLITDPYDETGVVDASVGYMGSGILAPNDIPTDTSDVLNGFYRDSSGIFGNNSAVISFGFNANRQTQIASSISAEEGYFARTMIADNTWTTPVEFYHTGNLNVNEFGGNAAADDVAEGIAKDTSTAFFWLPINSYVQPTSITVVSTFEIADEVNSFVVASGITPSLEVKSSGRLARLSVTGLSGLTGGQHLLLRQETASSKITVNF